ncbi:hypothetical protein BASA60_005219 [Batrachochytrium salamandrivorans]|nr:hypothetical protein BASA60_005219 [Batrachochytrium salamandrivorans]
MIRRTQGILGLFQGHSATLLRIFPYAAIKFMTYEQLKARMMPTKRDETALRKFLAGSIAGCASVFCSYPLDILRVRMAFDVRLNRPPSGLFETARAIYFEPKGTIKPTLNAMTNLTIGGMSGILAQTFSYPLEVIRRHMQVSARSALGQAHTTTLRTIKDIWGRKGIRGFGWVSVSATSKSHPCLLCHFTPMSGSRLNLKLIRETI